MRLPGRETRVWIDGRWTTAARAQLRLTDPGLLAGLGVFETLGVRAGCCEDLEPHLDRLARGAARLAVPLPEPGVLAAAASRVAREVAGAFGWVKIVATRGERRAVFGAAEDPDLEGRPAGAILLDWRRSPRDPLAGIKTLNYAPFALGLEQARAEGADEALWLNTRGHLAEGCTSNLFVIRRRTLFTPSERDGILPGITRERTIHAARRLGLAVHVGKVRLKRLETADEAFLTSSVSGVRPLVTFRGRPVGSGEAGPLTLEIAHEAGRRGAGRSARLPAS